MEERIRHIYQVRAEDYSTAGEASASLKKVLRQLGFDAEIIRRVAIAMYEGEINMVIHANGGTADAEISENKIQIRLSDSGPGIPDVALAMREGYSTASDRARSMGFGAGMGLPNIKRCSDEFEIETEVGKGTTLIITIYA